MYLMVFRISIYLNEFCNVDNYAPFALRLLVLSDLCVIDLCKVSALNPLNMDVKVGQYSEILRKRIGYFNRLLRHRRHLRYVRCEALLILYLFMRLLRPWEGR